MSEEEAPEGMYTVVFYGMDNFGKRYNGVCFIAPSLKEARSYIKSQQIGPDSMADTIADNPTEVPKQYRRGDSGHFARIYLTGTLIE